MGLKDEDIIANTGFLLTSPLCKSDPLQILGWRSRFDTLSDQYRQLRDNLAELKAMLDQEGALIERGEAEQSQEILDQAAALHQQYLGKKKRHDLHRARLDIQLEELGREMGVPIHPDRLSINQEEEELLGEDSSFMEGSRRILLSLEAISEKGGVTNL